MEIKVPELVPLIEQTLSQSAIEKPSQHIGGSDTDCIYVQIGLSDAETIRDAFVDMEVASVSPDGSTTALASYYAGLVDAWAGYLLWLEDDVN